MLRLTLSVLALAGMALPALAHPGHAVGPDAFTAGFTHPFLGLDHVLAMVAVGMWAARLGGRAVWLAPTAFITCMVGGFALAMAGVGLPAVEPGIAASVVVLGILIAAAIRLPLAASVALVGVFAVFHGHAHGAELTGAAAAFGLGFVAATALLHGAGIALGRVLAGRQRLLLARGLGGVVAGIGLVLLGGLA
jgi:urease accessory protein